jgi:uncharacterized protein GlcG (DUF336 family)
VKPALSLCALAIGALVCIAARAEGVRAERMITLDAALEAASAAQARCRKDGFQTTVTVLDRAGRTRVVLHLANITTAEGGLPIRAGNGVVGAIGVSGSPGGDRDAVCAQAGIDQIAKSLGSS